MGIKYRHVNQAVFTFLFSFSLALSQPALAEEPNSRIIGGEDYTENYPWMTALSLNNDPQNPECGSTLIAPEWILTAAHCVTTFNTRISLSASRLSVTIGETDLKLGSPVEEYRQIEKVVVHPSYNAENLNNDLALLKLSEASTLTPIKIARNLTPNLGTGSYLRTLGWGATSDDRTNLQLADTLKQVDLPVVEPNICTAAYIRSSAPIIDSKFCAGVKQGGIDSCVGDSGGPLVYKENGQWYQVGIVSYGKTCAAENNYSVNTRVSSFNDWIDCTTNNSCSSERSSASSKGGGATGLVFELIVGIFAFLFSVAFRSKDTQS